MRYRKLTRRLTPWLTLYLLVVSVGLPLQRVYCACIGQAEVTLAGAEHECLAHQPDISEHDHHRTACCKVATECQHPETAGHDCGSSDVILAQLDADFPKGEVSDLAVGLLPFAAVAFPDYNPLAAREVAKIRPVRGPDPPDRPAGRQLLVAHQTFLI